MIVQDRSGTFEISQPTSATFKMILPKSMLSLNNTPEWKHHRRVLGPSMSGSYLSKSANHIVKAVNELIEVWKLKAEKIQKGRRNC